MSTRGNPNPAVRLYQWTEHCRRVLSQSPIAFFDQCFVRLIFDPTHFRVVIKRWLACDSLDVEKLADVLISFFEQMGRIGTGMRLVLTANYIDFFGEPQYRIPLADLPSEILAAVALMSGGAHWREVFTVQKASVNNCELSGCRFCVNLPMYAVIESVISIFVSRLQPGYQSVAEFQRFLSNLTARSSNLTQRWQIPSFGIPYFDSQCLRTTCISNKMSNTKYINVQRGPGGEVGLPSSLPRESLLYCPPGRSLTPCHRRLRMRPRPPPAPRRRRRQSACP